MAQSASRRVWLWSESWYSQGWEYVPTIPVTAGGAGPSKGLLASQSYWNISFRLNDFFYKTTRQCDVKPRLLHMHTQASPHPYTCPYKHATHIWAHTMSHKSPVSCVAFVIPASKLAHCSGSFSPLEIYPFRSPGTDTFSRELCQISREKIMPILLMLFCEIEREQLQILFTKPVLPWY